MAMPKPDYFTNETIQRYLSDRKLMDPLFDDTIMKAILADKAPAHVVYADGKCTYLTPEKFYWQKSRSPSDSLWFVPGQQ